MTQSVDVTFYSMPWGRNSQSRPIFSRAVSGFDAYLTRHQIDGGYWDLGQMDFNPEQEFLIVPNDRFDNQQLDQIMQINYARVRVYTSASKVELYATYYYFVDGGHIQPTIVGEHDESTQIFRITLDPWGTYVIGASGNKRPMLKAGTIIEQSRLSRVLTFKGLYPNDTYSAAIPLTNTTPNDSHAGRGLVRRPISYEHFGNPETTTNRKRAFYFVGLFADSDNYTHILARPIYFFNFSSGNYASLSTLLGITKIEQNEINYETYTPTGSERYDKAVRQVNLIRAYIIPYGAIQEIENDTKHGYRIKETVQGAYDGAVSLASVSENYFRSFSVSVPFNKASIYGGITPPNNNYCRFVDIGTPTKRLQVLPPTDGGNSVPVSFVGQFGDAGYSLIMSVGNAQLDIGGDFEIPVPDNPQAEAFARNKWSMALQGVSQVGGIAFAVASKNPVAIVGSVMSAGQFVANTAEQLSNPSVIQGQGNGLLTYSVASERQDTLALDAFALGAVYARYAFETDEEHARAELYGYKWRAAYVSRDTELNGSKTLFCSYGENNEYEIGGLFIKTAGAVVGCQTEQYGYSAIPAKYCEELAELFDRGLWFEYDPTN